MTLINFISVMKRRFENLNKRAGRAVQHWWLLTIAGILGVAAGIAVFAFPLESYVTLSILFGVLMLITGAAKLIAASTSANFFMMRGYIIVGGVLDLLLGLFLCIYPGVTMALLPVMMGLWILYNGFMMIALAGDFDTLGIPGAGWIVGGSVVMIILSILVLVNPFTTGVATVVVLAGAGLILFGCLLFILSFKIRDQHKYFELEYDR